MSDEDQTDNTEEQPTVKLRARARAVVRSPDYHPTNFGKSGVVVRRQERG